MQGEQKPSVVVVGPLPPPYHGITISTRRLLGSRLGDEFRLIHFDTSDHRDMDNIGSFEIRNIALSLWNVLQLAWLCLRARPALVYLTVNRNIAYARDGLFILVSKCFCRAKVVIHLHGAHFREPYRRFPWPSQRFVDLTLSLADRAIVLGESLRYNFEKWFRAEEIDVIPNGTTFPAGLRRIPDPKDKSGLVVAFLGYLAEAKGVVEIVAAVPEILSSFPDTQFRFAGSWWNQDRAREKCEAIIRAHNLPSRVSFLGVLRDGAKWDFLMSADIFVFPSWDEGHPNAVIEAMAAGLPVVATPVGAIPETVIDSVTGFIVPLRSAPAIAEKVRLLVGDVVLRKKMSEAGRRRYETCYTEDRNIAAMIDCFRRCLA